MSTRIPSSLKWLIDKRARLAGEIEKTKKALETANQLVEELKNLEETLSAIDKTFELHNIRIDVNLIRSIDSKYVRLKLPHGSITDSIVTCLKIYGDINPVPKSEIVRFLIARHYSFDEKEEPYSQIARSVTKALNRMCRNGDIQRFHSLGASEEGLWKLKQHS